MGNNLVVSENRGNCSSLYKHVHDGDTLSIGLSKLIEEGGEYSPEIARITRKLCRKRMIDYTFRQDGRTHLHMSLALNASPEVVRMLFHARANVNRQDIDGITPFILAVKLSHASSVNLMLKRAKLDLNTSENRSALYYAVEQKHESNIKTLVKAKCNMHFRNEEGDTPLHVMVKTRLPQMCKFLLSYGAEINVSDALMRSPIALAVSIQDSQVLFALLTSKRIAYDPQTRLRVKKKSEQDVVNREVMAKTLASYDIFGDTPLLLASKLEWDYGVEILLYHEADPNQSAATNPLYTPLIAALSPPNVPICRLILEALANANDNVDSRTLLVNANAEISCHGQPLMLALKHQHKEAIKILCEYKADVGDALLQAAKGDRHRFVRRMIRMKADIDAREDVTGFTPLHIACGTACDESIITLLQGKADVNALDAVGWTPVMHYLHQEHPRSWEELRRRALKRKHVLDGDTTSEDEEVRDIEEETPEEDIDYCSTSSKTSSPFMRKTNVRYGTTISPNGNN